MDKYPENLELKIKELYYRVNSPLPQHPTILNPEIYEYPPIITKKKKSGKIWKFAIAGIIAIAGTIAVEQVIEQNQIASFDVEVSNFKKLAQEKRYEEAEEICNRLNLNSISFSSALRTRKNELNQFVLNEFYPNLVNQKILEITSIKEDKAYTEKEELDKLSMFVNSHVFKDKPDIEKKIKQIYDYGRDKEQKKLEELSNQLNEIKTDFNAKRYKIAETKYNELTQINNKIIFGYLIQDKKRFNKELDQFYQSSLKPKIDEKNRFTENINNFLTSLEEMLNKNIQINYENNNEKYPGQTVATEYCRCEKWLEETLSQSDNALIKEEKALYERIKTDLERTHKECSTIAKMNVNYFNQQNNQINIYINQGEIAKAKELTTTLKQKITNFKQSPLNSDKYLK